MIAFLICGFCVMILTLWNSLEFILNLHCVAKAVTWWEHIEVYSETNEGVTSAELQITRDWELKVKEILSFILSLLICYSSDYRILFYLNFIRCNKEMQRCAKMYKDKADLISSLWTLSQSPDLIQIVFTAWYLSLHLTAYITMLKCFIFNSHAPIVLF